MNPQQLFTEIAGRDNEFQLEHRVFNTLTFSTTILCVLAMLFNSLLALSGVATATALIGSLISAGLFYSSRLMKKFNSYVLFCMIGSAMVLIIITYPSDAGSFGSLPFVFISLAHVFFVISKDKLQFIVFFLLYLTIISLFWFESFFPELVIKKFATADVRLLDFGITMSYSLVLIFVTTITFKRSYNRERNRVVTQNEELVILNKRFSEKAIQVEVLMKELSHRVKNNLQVISSLLHLQANRLTDPDARAAVLESRNRLLSMVLLHQKLYTSDQPTTINMKEYIHDLAHNLIDSNGIASNQNLQLNLENISMKIELAVPLGLIINELVTNSLKYAFVQERRENKIVISFLNMNNQLELTVSDNGKGFAKTSTNSFGLQLVNSLVKQLEGTLTTDSTHGTKATIIISLEENGN